MTSPKSALGLSNVTYVPSRIGEIQDFLGYMVLTCPDFFEPEENMDCERAFAVLLEGLDLVRKGIGEVRFGRLVEMANEARDLYASGDERAGCFRLQDMKDYLRSRSD
jgi:hypothetical protein